MTFQHRRSFPAIRRKLLATRLLPYECNFGLLLCKPTSTVPPVLYEAADHRAVNIAAVPALQALQSRSSKFVLKMLTTISEEIPFCKEEVEAASKYLNSRFNALNARIKSITSIQDTNPSRWPFHHFLFCYRNKAKTAHNGKYLRKKPGRLTSEAVITMETWLVNNFAVPCEYWSQTAELNHILIYDFSKVMDCSATTFELLIDAHVRALGNMFWREGGRQ